MEYPRSIVEFATSEWDCALWLVGLGKPERGNRTIGWAIELRDLVENELAVWADSDVADFGLGSNESGGMSWV